MIVGPDLFQVNHLLYLSREQQVRINLNPHVLMVTIRTPHQYLSLNQTRVLRSAAGISSHALKAKSRPSHGSQSGGGATRGNSNFTPDLDGAILSRVQNSRIKTRFQFHIMKPLHPAAPGLSSRRCCVSSLLLQHSVKTFSQEVKAWRKEREMCVCVSHSPKNISHIPPSCSLCRVTLTCESELQLSGLEAAGVQGRPADVTARTPRLSGSEGADGAETGRVEKQEETEGGSAQHTELGQLLQLHRPETKWLPAADSREVL